MNSDKDKVVTIKCDKCGCSNSSDSKFCEECGNKFKKKNKKLFKKLIILFAIMFVFYIVYILIKLFIMIFLPGTYGEIEAKKYIKEKYNIDAEVISSNVDVHRNSMFGTYQGRTTTVYMKTSEKTFEVIVGGEQPSDTYQYEEIWDDFISQICNNLNSEPNNYSINFRFPSNVKYNNQKYDGSNLSYFINRSEPYQIDIYHSIDGFKKLNMSQFRKTIDQLNIELNEIAYYLIRFNFIFGEKEDLVINYNKIMENKKYNYSIYDISLSKEKYDEIGINNAKELFYYLIDDDVDYYFKLKKLDNGRIELKAYSY